VIEQTSHRLTVGRHRGAGRTPRSKCNADSSVFVVVLAPRNCGQRMTDRQRGCTTRAPLVLYSFDRTVESKPSTSGVLVQQDSRGNVHSSHDHTYPKHNVPRVKQDASKIDTKHATSENPRFLPLAAWKTKNKCWKKGTPPSPFCARHDQQRASTALLVEAASKAVFRFLDRSAAELLRSRHQQQK